jgi:hypothetical protein
MPPSTKRNPNAKFHRPTRGELFSIGRLLEQHCHKLPDGFSHYDKGWDDATIAKAVGDHIAIASVSFYRAQEYGKIRDGTRGLAYKKRKAEEDEPLAAALAGTPLLRRIAELEAVVKMLQTSSADLELRHSALVRRYVRLERAHNTTCAILGSELDKRFVSCISGEPMNANGADSKPGATG